MSEVTDFGPVFDIPEEELAQEQPPQEQTQTEAIAEQPPAKEPETQQPESTEEQPEARHVPLVALLDEREKRQAAQREADELRRQIEAQRKPQQPAQVPDPYEDPAGFQQHVQNQIDERSFAVTAEISGRFAEQKYGKETVEEAVRWAQAEGAQRNPFLGQQVRTSNDPVGFVVEQYQREQFWQKYGSDPSALQQLVTTQPIAAPQPAAPAAPKPIAPPRSLAAAPGAGGGHQSIPDGSVLDSVKFNLD